jgi:serine/threonine-protein kinase
MIIGTAAYMAPEQARGRGVDKRVDVWAFGVVLYEMIAGQKAFSGEDVSDTLASVIKFDPDWTKLPADTPTPIRRLLKRCMAKDPKQRLGDCRSALLEIRDAQSGEGVEASSLASGLATPTRHSWLPLLAAGVLAVGAGGGVWALLSWPTPATPSPTRRFTITLPEGEILPVSAGTVVSIAPDGRTLLYRANRGSERRLYRRALDQFEATSLIGIADPIVGGTAISPDGRWIVFEVNRTLRKIPSGGGPAQTVTSFTFGIRGLSWTPEGNLVVGMNAAGGGLLLVPIAGGTATELFKAPEGRRALNPHVFLNGKAVLFTVAEVAADPGELYVRLLETSEQKPVLTEAAAGRVLPTGHLVFVRSGSLWAVPFDQSRLEVRGTPVPVIEQIRVESGGAVQYDISDDGTLVFVPGAPVNRDQRPLLLVSIDGKVSPVPAPLRSYTSARLSPDGTRIAAQIDLGDAADVWVVDIARGALTRLTTDPGFDGSPMWSPDGRSVVFSSTRGGQWSLHRKMADGTGNDELIASVKSSTATAVYPTAWTADGQLAVMANLDIGLVPADGKGEWKPLIQTPATETQPAISPDGRWIAYGSNETGAGEVYVQRFPHLGDRQLVSVDGGFMPTWSHDGRALFYLRGGPPRDIMRVAIEPLRDGGLRISTPDKVADWSFYAAQFAPRYYDVGPDGRLVVIGLTATDSTTTLREINVVTNWFEELKRLVPIP